MNRSLRYQIETIVKNQVWDQIWNQALNPCKTQVWNHFNDPKERVMDKVYRQLEEFSEPKS